MEKVSLNKIRDFSEFLLKKKKKSVLFTNRKISPRPKNLTEMNLMVEILVLLRINTHVKQ